MWSARVCQSCSACKHAMENAQLYSTVYSHLYGVTQLAAASELAFVSRLQNEDSINTCIPSCEDVSNHLTQSCTAYTCPPPPSPPPSPKSSSAAPPSQQWPADINPPSNQPASALAHHTNNDQSLRMAFRDVFFVDPPIHSSHPSPSPSITSAASHLSSGLHVCTNGQWPHFHPSSLGTWHAALSPRQYCRL